MFSLSILAYLQSMYSLAVLTEAVTLGEILFLAHEPPLELLDGRNLSFPVFFALETLTNVFLQFSSAY